MQFSYLLRAIFLTCFMIVSGNAVAKPFSKEVCDAGFPSPSTLRKSFNASPISKKPEYQSLVKQYLQEYAPLYKRKKELCALGDKGPDLKQRLREIGKKMQALEKPHYDAEIAKTEKEIERTRRKIAEWDPRYRKSTDNIGAGSQGCVFSACSYGKAKCCQMARAQLNECQAADNANSGLYSLYGQEGAASSSAIKECVRCSRVWLRQNGC